MLNSSILVINRQALKNNYNFLKKRFGKKVRISSVVKGNAYGHGIEAIVPIAEESGIDHFSVFNADEALRVKNVSQKMSGIMIMGMLDNTEIEWAVKNDIEFFVFDFNRLESALKMAKEIKHPARIHIEVETGMNRTGFNAYELEKVYKYLEEYKGHYNLEGLCTHYAGAESIANYVRIKSQHSRYNKIYKLFCGNGFVPLRRHTACSAASISYPQTRMDMVRIGILQYGFWPSRETFIDFIHNKKEKKDPLKRVITWKSRVMSVKKIPTGEFIGYGTSYLAQRDMKIATVPVGYGYGFSRSLSNHGRVLIQGSRVPVVGLVNMNIMMVDVTDLENTKAGDEVVLIGSQGGLTISFASFSEMSDQMNYEALTRLPRDIPRLIE